MNFRDIVMAAATQGGGAALPPGPLWSAAATGAIADPAAWSFFGAAISVSSGRMNFTAATSTSTATLTGAYATALEAAVATNTAFTMELDITNWVSGASARIQLRNSVVNTYGSIAGNGTQSFAITSGAGPAGTAPLRLTGLAGLPYTYAITDIRIYA